MKMLSRLQPQFLSILRIVSAFVFALHGWQKVFGLFGGLPAGLPANVHTMLMTGGWIETIASVFLFLGLFTSPVAFIVSGEMAIAYFVGHVARAGNLLPIVNQGDPAVLFCFIFLYLASAGGGPWSLDHLLRRSK